jgi:N-formylglutamate amidohydrolase
MFLRRYLKVGKGKIPVILVCAHGGSKKPRNIPDKLFGSKKSDRNTYQITKQIIASLKNHKRKIYYILSKIHRSKIDLNRPISSSDAFNSSSNRAYLIHKLFHKRLSKLVKKCIARYGRCIIFDIHGFTKPGGEYPDIIFGHLYGKTLSQLNYNENLRSNQKGFFHQLREEISKNFTLDDGLQMNELNLEYCGGYITQKFCEKDNIEAIQLEMAKNVRLEAELKDKIISAIVRVIEDFI